MKVVSHEAAWCARVQNGGVARREVEYNDIVAVYFAPTW